MKLSYRLHSLCAITAPAGLRWRVAAALDAEDRAAAKASVRGRWIAPWTAAIAAAAVILLLLGNVASRGRNEPSSIATLIAHASFDPGSADSFASSDPVELGFWLESQVRYHVDVPTIADAVLLGGHVAELNRVRTAVMTYTLQGRHLTYFAMPSAAVLGTQINTDQVTAVSVGELNVATWTEAGAARAVVSPMDQWEVVAVAKECRRNAIGS